MKMGRFVRGLVIDALLVLPLVRCGSDESPLDACDDIFLQASEARGTVLEGADRACSVDEECVVFAASLSCIDDCGNSTTAVSRSAEPQLALGVQAIDRAVCGDFFERGCKLEVNPCVSPGTPTAFCRGSRCELEYVW